MARTNFPISLSVLVYTLSLVLPLVIPGSCMYTGIDDHSYFSFSVQDLRPMEIDMDAFSPTENVGPSIQTAVDENMQNNPNPFQLENIILEEVALDIKDTEDFDYILQRHNEVDEEYNQQDRYLTSFGLQRNPIIGDGNCLFRSVSHSLYGHQNNHQQLRKLAVETLRGNIDIFRNYFIEGSGSPREQIDHLGQPNTYAGQECILALAMALNINIMVTVGGESNNRVATYENSFTPDQPQQTIHIIWRRPGGGHYESVTEKQETTSPLRRIDPPGYNDNINTRPWQKETEFIRPVQLHNFVKNDQPSTGMSSVHTYAKQHSILDSQTETKHGTKICTDCRISFKNTVNLRKHIKRFHSDEGQGQTENHKMHSCITSACQLKFRTVDQLIEHAISVHEANIKIEHHTFDDLRIFSEFRSREELASNTRFVRRSKSQVNKRGDKTYCLICHRNGQTKRHRAKGVNPRTTRKNRKGHCQINGLCPARLSVCEKKDGKVQVKYVKSHTHSLSFEQSKYLPIPESLKSDILSMLSFKIPVNSIMEKVREHFSDRDNRDNLEDLKYYHLIGKKTIHNLKTKLADPSIIQDSNDAVSTALKVEALQQELFNPILFFKQQGIEDNLRILNKEDFLLAIMTKQQLDMYAKCGCRILCMDSTHKTNTYEFKLITLMVPDEYRKGYPVAFCISNREDETAIALFLSFVKDRSPDTRVNIIMTDDDNAGWNAAKSVYGSNLQHFLCTWHIQRSWIRNLHNHFRNDGHKTEVYCYLCAMLHAKSETDFNTYKRALISKLETINPAFLKYLTDHYFNRPEKWSVCFRKGTDYCNVNTNMFVESFHNQLKTIYFSGKRNRRVDVLIDTLLRIENEHFVRHLQRVSYNNPTDEDVCMQDRHNKGLEIDNTKVKQITGSVFSLESSTETYIIESILEKCSHEHCYTKCKNLPCINLCNHMYTCTCTDFHNGHVCKHIHKIHSFSRTPIGQTNDSVDESDLELVIPDPVTVEPSTKSSETQLQHITGLINELGQQLQDPMVKKYRYMTIIKSLESLISGNKACVKLEDNLPAQLTVKERIAGNANNILQPRFHSTVGKKGRPKKAPLKRPTEEDMKKLLRGEEQVSQTLDHPTTTGELHGSVAQYPPLRLVPPPVGGIQLTNSPEQPLFSVGQDGLGQMSWMRIPPAMLGKRIRITRNGKTEHIIFSSSGTQEDPDQE